MSPAEDMAPQSSRKFLAQHSPNAVSMRRAGSHVTHCKIETRQRVSDSSTLPRLIQSFPKDSRRLRNSRTVSSRHERNVKTHRESEVFTRASSRVVSPRVDKTPPAGVLERFEKRSIVATRPAIERALSPPSTEMGERRRAPSDTIANMQPKAMSPWPCLPGLEVAREQSIQTILSRELPPGSSLTGIKPSSRAVSVPASPKRVDVRMHKKSLVKREVKMEKGKKAIKHAPVTGAALTLPELTPVSTIRAPLPSLSFQAIPTQHMPNDVKTRHRVNEMAHHVAETRTKALMETATLRFGKTRPASSIERVDERSIIDIGPAVRPALISSSEIGVRLRTAVSVQNDVEKNRYAPNPSTAITLPVATPAAPSVHHTRAIAHSQRPGESKPPFEMVSR